MTDTPDKKLQRLFSIGRPFSPLYGLLMTLRSSLYGKGFLKQHRLEMPVISVGNLVLGGTGKTPLVIYIAKLLQKHGRQVAVLSRGYKGTATGLINIVSNPDDILLEAAAAGDEPRLLAEKLPGIPVLTGKKRFVTGRFAIDSFGADILLLDDGFQHQALYRDLDLVLFSAGKCLGNGRVFPGGDLREPVSSLERAGGFIISGVNGPEPDSTVEKLISLLTNHYPRKPLFMAGYQPENNLVMINDRKNETITLERATRMHLYGFCGIAAPGSFKTTLERGGIKLTGFQEFTDHHSYSATDIQTLVDHAKNTGAEGLITTEKDLVKLGHFFPQDLPLLVQPVQLQLDENFDRFIISCLNKIPEFHQ